MKNQTLSHPFFFRAPVLLLVTALALPRLALAQSGAGNQVSGDEATRVKIQINTASTEDDMVALGGSVPCLVRLSMPSTEDLTVTLVNPATAPMPRRLSFGHASIPASPDGTLTLTLPKDGKAVAFSIGGLTKSEKVGDAAIEAHKDGATGELKGGANASVYWFDPRLVVVTGGNYGWNPDKSRYIPVTGDERGVTLIAHAGLKPTGLSPNAPQFAGLQMGIIQNATGKRIVTYKSDPSRFQWLEPNALNRSLQKAPASLSVTYNQFEGGSASIPGTLLDSENAPSAGSPDNYFYNPPVPVSQGTIRAFDTPEVEYGPAFQKELRDEGGALVATVLFEVERVTMNDFYTTWMTLGPPTVPPADPPVVRQASWELNIDSSVVDPEKPQHATTHADAPASSKPIIVGPVANASLQQGPTTSSGTKTTRTYPQ